MQSKRHRFAPNMIVAKSMFNFAIGKACQLWNHDLILTF